MFVMISQRLLHVIAWWANYFLFAYTSELFAYSCELFASFPVNFSRPFSPLFSSVCLTSSSISKAEIFYVSVVRVYNSSSSSTSKSEIFYVRVYQSWMFSFHLLLDFTMTWKAALLFEAKHIINEQKCRLFTPTRIKLGEVDFSIMCTSLTLTER